MTWVTRTFPASRARWKDLLKALALRTVCLPRVSANGGTLLLDEIGDISPKNPGRAMSGSCGLSRVILRKSSSG
jgi:hypothetical protein